MILACRCCQGLAHDVHIGAAYFAVHATTPQTLGYLFADSPMGFLAWYYERLVKLGDDRTQWTEEDGMLSKSKLARTSTIMMHNFSDYFGPSPSVQQCPLNVVRCDGHQDLR
jgi:hypothetical protein